MKTFLDELEELIAASESEPEELEEINAMGTGAVVGYTLPLGAKPTFDASDKKRKRSDQWYDIKRENVNNSNEKKLTLKVKNDAGKQVAIAVVVFDGTKAYLDSVFLEPDLRGKGLGKNFYKLINKEIKKRFNVSLTSSDFLTKNSKNIWKSFEKSGEAKKISNDTYMLEQVSVYNEYNWGLHPIEGPKFWDLFKNNNTELYYHPNPLTLETYKQYDFGKDKGAWLPTARKNVILSANPEEKTITSHTSLLDPRLAYALTTNVKYIPEIGDYILKIQQKHSSESKPVGRVGNIIKNVKKVSSKTPEWNKDREEKYSEYKFELLQDVSDINWYHATTLANLKSILQTGLKPSNIANQGQGWTQQNLNLQNAVYLTADEEYALDIAETLLARTGSPGVVIKIFGKAIHDKQKIVVDEDSLRNDFDDMLSGGMLQPGMPSYFTSVLDEKITALGYKDTISPANLLPMYVLDANRDGERFSENAETEVYTWAEWRRRNKQIKINEQKKTKKKIKTPFPYFEPDDHGMDAFDIFITKKDAPYKTGKVMDIDLYAPNLFSTQKYVETETMEKQQSGEWKGSSDFPVVIDFYDGNRYIQDGHHRLSSAKLRGEKTAKALVIVRPEGYKGIWSEELYKLENKLVEEFLGVNGGVRYFQVGGSLPAELYNRDKSGKPTKDPGIGFLRKRKKAKKK